MSTIAKQINPPLKSDIESSIYETITSWYVIFFPKHSVVHIIVKPHYKLRTAEGEIQEKTEIKAVAIN